MSVVAYILYIWVLQYITYGLGSFECSTCSAESKRYGRKALARLLQLDNQSKTTLTSDIDCLLVILMMMMFVC